MRFAFGTALSIGFGQVSTMSARVRSRTQPPTPPWRMRVETQASAQSEEQAASTPISKKPEDVLEPPASAESVPPVPVPPVPVPKARPWTARRRGASQPTWATALDQDESARHLKSLWKKCEREECTRFIAIGSFSHCCCYCRKTPELGHTGYCRHRQPDRMAIASMASAGSLVPSVPGRWVPWQKDTTTKPVDSNQKMEEEEEKMEDDFYSMDDTRVALELNKMKGKEEAMEWVLCQLRLHYNKEPLAKPASVSASSSWEEASAESQFHTLQASIAALRREMESMDTEEFGSKMLAGYHEWQDRQALDKSTWFRDRKRWEHADWSAWNSWKGDSWKSDSWKGDSWMSDSWKGESKTEDGMDRVATLKKMVEEVQKRQEDVASSNDHDELMKALGDTVKMHQQIYQLFSEGGANTAQAKASAESAAPQEEASMIEEKVPMNADGECEAVARVIQRDLAGCLLCIRASGQQVVVGAGV